MSTSPSDLEGAVFGMCATGQAKPGKTRNDPDSDLVGDREVDASLN